MKTIKLTLALLAFMIGINSCASIIGSSKDIMMSVQKRSFFHTWKTTISPF
jgi:hypothetical protein